MKCCLKRQINFTLWFNQIFLKQYLIAIVETKTKCDLNYNKEEREAKTLTGCEPCF